MKTHLYCSDSFALGVTWRKRASLYAPRGFRFPALSRRLPHDRCPPRGKTSNSRRGGAAWLNRTTHA